MRMSGLLAEEATVGAYKRVAGSPPHRVMNMSYMTPNEFRVGHPHAGVWTYPSQEMEAHVA